MPRWAPPEASLPHRPLCIQNLEESLKTQIGLKRLSCFKPTLGSPYTGKNTTVCLGEDPSFLHSLSLSPSLRMLPSIIMSSSPVAPIHPRCCLRTLPNRHVCSKPRLHQAAWLPSSSGPEVTVISLCSGSLWSASPLVPAPRGQGRPLLLRLHQQSASLRALVDAGAPKACRLLGLSEGSGGRTCSSCLSRESSQDQNLVTALSPTINKATRL